MFFNQIQPQEGRCAILVLSRKLHEKIYIGDDIVITIVDIDRGKVRVGVQAQRDIPVHRGELLELAEQKRITENAGGYMA